MLTIRPEQIAIFDLSSRQEFVRRLSGHLNRVFAPACSRLGQERVTEIVELGVERATWHGYGTEREIAYYLNLMMFLGCDLDRDPFLPWLSELMIAEALPEPSALYGAVGDYLDRTAGERNEYLVRALLRIRDHDFDADAGPAFEDIEVRLYALLCRLYPQKAAFHSPLELTQALRQVVAEGRERGLTTAKGAAVYSVLAWMLGSGFHSDPAHPWAGHCLAEDGPTREQRAEDLRRAGVAYIEWSLSPGATGP